MSRSAVLKRLRSYWQLELGNVVFVPVGTYGVLQIMGVAMSWPTMAAAFACAVILLIGAQAWRMELANLEGRRNVAAYWTPILARLQPAALALALGAAAIVTWRLVTFGDLWGPDAIAAAALGLLAVAEYVNYYHVQLQHFDNWADFKRLITGKGFRRAHLARAIAAWKAKS